MTEKRILSALMSVYNGEKFIEESINSILNQTFSDFELIIIDDGSTDKTVQILNRFQDERLKLIMLKDNVGVGKALSIGLTHVSGDYIAKVDADDIYHPQRFEKQLNYLLENSEIDVVDSYIEYFSDEEEIIKSQRFKNLKDNIEKQINSVYESKDIQKSLYMYVCITHSSIMFKKEILNKASYKGLTVGEDYDLFYNWNKNGVNFAKLREKLSFIRVSENSTTVSQKGKIVKGLINIKKEEILKIFELHNRVYIWGIGSLANETYKSLNDLGAEIKGFIDQSAKSNSTLIFNDKRVYNFDTLSKSDLKFGIIICASPIKEEVMKLLEINGYKHLDDYITIF